MDANINEVKEGIFDNETLELNVNLAYVEKAKNNFLLNLDNFSKEEAISTFKNLIYLMDTLLLKYFDYEEIEKVKVDNCTFHEVMKNLNILNDLNESDVKEILRDMARISFSIYNKFLNRMRVGIPLVKKDFKKKVVENFFELLNFRDYGYENFDNFYFAFLNKYNEKIKKLNIKDLRINFLAYAYSELQNYDLDAFSIITGFPRSGKSTLALQLFFRILAFKENLTLREAKKRAKDLLFTNVFYIPDLKSLARRFEKEEKQVFVIDEGYFSVDRRNALEKVQVELTKSVNAFANRNHIVFVIIQFYDDIDTRFLKRATNLFWVYERGKALLFSKQKSFTFRASSSFGLAKYENKEYFYDKQTWLYILKKKALTTIRFKALKGNPNLIISDYIEKLRKEKLKPNELKFYDLYLVLKSYYQLLYSKTKEKEEVDKLKEAELIDKLRSVFRGKTYESKLEYLTSKGLTLQMAKKILRKCEELDQLEALEKEL